MRPAEVGFRAQPFLIPDLVVAGHLNIRSTLFVALVTPCQCEPGGSVVQFFKYGEERKPPSVFIRELERGSPVEVEGYQFSGKLWQDSFHFDLPPALREESTARAEYKRPVRIVKLGREASPLVKAGTVADDRAKDFTWLFSDNWEWIAASIEEKVRNIS